MALTREQLIAHIERDDKEFMEMKRLIGALNYFVDKALFDDEQLKATIKAEGVV